MTEDRPKTGKLLGRTLLLWAVMGLAFNFTWEMLQRPLYTGQGSFEQHAGQCFVASLWDVGLLAGLYIFLCLVTRERYWFLRLSGVRLLLLAVAGFVIAVFIELRALDRGQWRYAPAMPRVPGLGVGWSPVPGAAALVEAIAAVRVRHLRAERSPLDGRLYTEIRGQGDPMVFLAGLPGTTAYWDHRFDSLASHHRLIFVDALGFGRSPWPDAEYTLDDHLRALRRTLVAEGARERVTFVAHSFGALLAAHYAARYPAEVEHLYLLGTPVFKDEKEALEHIRAMSSTGGMFSINPIVAREACKLHEAFDPLLTWIVPRLMKDLPPDLVRGAMLHTWQSFDGTLRHVVLSKPIAVPLARLGGKVTFVHGRADEVTSLQRTHALAARIGARVVETDDDHTSYSFRNPAPIVAALARRPEV